jgi:hypothetical protein
MQYATTDIPHPRHRPRLKAKLLLTPWFYDPLRTLTSFKIQYQLPFGSISLILALANHSLHLQISQFGPCYFSPTFWDTFKNVLSKKKLFHPL